MVSGGQGRVVSDEWGAFHGVPIRSSGWGCVMRRMSDEKRAALHTERFAVRHAAEIRDLLLTVACMRDFRGRALKYAAAGNGDLQRYYLGAVLNAVEALLEHPARLDTLSSCGACVGTGRGFDGRTCVHCAGRGEYVLAESIARNAALDVVKGGAPDGV